jgi:hypothetical protein
MARLRAREWSSGSIGYSWREVAFVGAGGEMPEFTVAARNARNKVRAQALFLAAKVALLPRSSTGTPKAVPKYATARDHQHHGSTLHVAHGSNQLSIRRLLAS